MSRAGTLVVVLGGLAVAFLAAAWVAPRVSDAAGRWLEQEAVRTRSVGVDGLGPGEVSAGASISSRTERRVGLAGTTVVDAGMTFNLLGLVGRAEDGGGPDGGARGEETAEPVAGDARAGAATDGAPRGAEVELRVSADGATWSRWITLELLASPRDSGEPSQAAVAARAELASEPVWVGEARYVEFRRSGPVRDLRFSFVNSLGDATVADRVGGVLKGALATIARIGVTDAALADGSAGPGMPPIVTRRQWGADESWRRADPLYSNVKMAFIHHTASLNTYSAEEAPAVVRAVYSYHARTLKFNDIGYNFLVDRYGVIYEGRYGGMDKGVVGAQTLGFNTGSTGISVIGNYEGQAPPPAALVSLERLLAWKLGVHGIAPASPVPMYCFTSDKYKAGQYVTLPAISAHRDANYTACPGAAFYARLAKVRTAVVALTAGTTDRVFYTRALRNFGTRRGTVAVFRFKVYYAPGSADATTYSRAVVVLKVRDAKGRSRYTKVYTAAALNKTLRHKKRLFVKRGTYRYSIYSVLPDGVTQQKLGSGRMTVR